MLGLLTGLGLLDLQHLIYSRLSPEFDMAYINDFSDDVICNIAIYADDTSLTLNMIRHLICGNN